MSLIAHNELLQKALTFLIETYKNQPDSNITELIDEASMRFNLTPIDALHLMKLFIGKTHTPHSNLPINTK